MSATCHDLAQAAYPAAAAFLVASQPSTLACQGCVLAICKGHSPVPAQFRALYVSCTVSTRQPIACVIIPPLHFNGCTYRRSVSVLPESQGCHCAALPDVIHLLDLALVGSAIAIGRDGNLPVLLHLVVQSQPHSQGHLRGYSSIASCPGCRLTSVKRIPGGPKLGCRAALTSAGDPPMCAW